MKLDKTVKQLKKDWEKASHHRTYMDSIAQGITNCPEFMVRQFFQDGYRILKPQGYYIFQQSIRDHHEVVKSPSRATDMVRWTGKELKLIAKQNNYTMLNSLSETFKIWKKQLYE